MTEYKSIDLFAGIGGIRLGFEQAFGNGIETVFVSEMDKNAVKTYRANFSSPTSPSEKTCDISGDITKIDAADIPSFDICLAGFPCQAFSRAGKRMGFADDYKGRSRGTLFAEVVRICEVHRPKVIFCENVKGLVGHDKGNTFKVIIGAFEQIGYKVFYKVLNSKDFGVPQNRERIYIVAFRNDIAPDVFEFPIGSDSDTCIEDILEKGPVSTKYYLSTSYLDFCRRHRAKHEALGHGFGYIIRDRNEKAGAVVCGGMGRERNLIIDHSITDYTPVTNIKGEVSREDVRRMTPREWARLQGFPDSFVFPLADTPTYKQLGNSVTVPVIKAIASNIRDVLAETDINSHETDIAANS